MTLESGKGQHLETQGQETCEKTKKEDKWLEGALEEEGEA